jgi:hypothetical protein
MQFPGELLGVDLGVIAVAVVEQHVGHIGGVGQAPDPWRPFS